MFDWLVSLGFAITTAKNIISLVNAGLTIWTIVSFFSTLGVGAGLILSLKGILKYQGFEAALR